MQTFIQNKIFNGSHDIASKSHFYAGVVLYNPDGLCHIESIRILLSLKILVVVFDNSDQISVFKYNKSIIEQLFLGKVHFLDNSCGNIGLSAAFNRIVDVVLRDDTAKGLYLFDQDTDVNLNALHRLNDSFEYILSKSKLGLIAGYPLRENGVPYRVRRKTLYEPPISTLIEVIATASSFSLIPVSTLRSVGTFQEDFFIDFIDYDFCIRCGLKDLPVYIDTLATFTHRVGLGDVIVGRKYLCPIASPFRNYYQVRNIILSGARSETSVWSTIKLVLIRYLSCILTSIYAGKGLQRLWYTLRGTVDGIRGRGGKLRLS